MAGFGLGWEAEKHSKIPWKETAGTTDRLSHEYDDLDYQVLWDAVQPDTPNCLRLSGTC